MDELKRLSNDIWDELEGAKHYADMAVKYKMTDATRAGTYAEMARQELGHAEHLQKMADRILSNHKAENAEAGKLHEAVWNWEKDKLHDRMSHIRGKIEMAK